MGKIQDRLKEIQEEEKILLGQLEKLKSYKKFLCGCGKLHAIKDCDVIQSYWLESAQGYTDACWHSGELQIICPDTNSKNRLLWENKGVPYQLRNHYSHSAEQQFSRKFRHLFKSVIHDYDEDRRSWWNNYYIDQNHKKFELEIPK